MSPLIILVVPVVAATTIAVASCILAGRRERFFEDPTLDEETHQQPSLPPTRPSTDPAPLQARVPVRPDHT